LSVDEKADLMADLMAVMLVAWVPKKVGMRVQQRADW
jgi:hypothetical protein